jgi:hypothetical protein
MPSVITRGYTDTVKWLCEHIPRLHNSRQSDGASPRDASLGAGPFSSYLTIALLLLESHGKMTPHYIPTLNWRQLGQSHPRLTLARE